VSQVSASELDEVSEFLQRCFNASPDAPFASRKMLRWKYLEPGEFGVDEAAFILGANERIVAHAGWRSATFRAPHGAHLTCGTIIDWAAERAAPGAGIALYRHLMGQAEASYLIGGTSTTQAVAERLGFRRVTRARVYARWVRPLDEFMRRPKTARSALRLLHGVAHAPMDRLAPSGEWSLSSVSSFDDSVLDVLASTPVAHAAAVRSVENLNHRLRNPTVLARGHVLLRRGKVMACAVSSLGTWNARILGVYGKITSPEDYAAVYALLTRELALDPSVCRVSVLTSAAAQQHGLSENGYWVNRVEPVSFYDPAGRVPSLGPIDIQYLDADLDDYNS